MNCTMLACVCMYIYMYIYTNTNGRTNERRYIRTGRHRGPRRSVGGPGVSCIDRSVRACDVRVAAGRSGHASRSTTSGLPPASLSPPRRRPPGLESNDRGMVRPSRWSPGHGQRAAVGRRPTVRTLDGRSVGQLRAAVRHQSLVREDRAIIANDCIPVAGAGSLRFSR